MGKKNLMKNLGLMFVLAGVMASMNLISSARAGGNGGEHIPSLNDINTMKFELSDGEAYQIAGDIVMIGNQAYLMVDLKAQPWLATNTRVSFPYYPLVGGNSFWSPYVGKHVAYLCLAEGDIVEGEYQISLRPIKSDSCDESTIQEITDHSHR